MIIHIIRQKTSPLLLFLLTTQLYASYATAAMHYPAEKTEPTHAKALIEYNAGHYSNALALLDGLLSSYPEYVPALELKALILRRQQRNDDALAVYRYLINISKTPAQRAPYHFDSGAIYFERKNNPTAKAHFTESIRGGFNYGASCYFLGLMAYGDGQWEEAESYFNATHWSSAKDLHGMAAFYLGLTHAKLGTSSGVLWGFKGADDYAREQENSTDVTARKAAEGIRKVTTEVLKNYSKHRFYGSAMLTVQYDTNLPSYPDVIANQSPTSKKSTKGVAALTLGYYSPQTKLWQVNASYRNYYNYNFNKDAKGYSWFSNIGAVTLTAFPAKRFSFGIKTDANLTYNDHQESGQTVYRPFSLVGNAGPFFKLEYVPRLIMTYELTYRPKKYYLDLDSQPDLQRTGNGVYNKFAVSWDSLKKWLTPSGFISYEDDSTHGVEYRADIWSYEVANVFKLSTRDNLSVAFDFTESRYGSRRGIVRVDKQFVERVLYSHTFNDHLAGLIDVSYTRNLSTLPDSYQYSRFLSSVGVNLSI